MTYDQLLKDATEQADLWAKARDRADLLARSEHAAKLAESKAQEIMAFDAKFAALEGQYGRRIRDLDVAATAHQAELEASMAPLVAKLAQAEVASTAKVGDLERKVAGLQDQLQSLITQRASLQGEVAGLERKKVDLESAWEKVRQKVGVA